MGESKSAGKGSGKKTLSGTVHHVDLEGGYYTLRTKSGEVYKLDGGGSDLRRAGVSAEVEGDIDRHSFSISFGTPILRVRSYKIL